MIAPSGMRTWRPTRTKTIRRSAMRRRGNRSEVPRRSAASWTVGSRGAGEQALQVVLVSEPQDAGRLGAVVAVEGAEGLVPGGQDGTRGRAEVAADGVGPGGGSEVV